MKIFTWEDRREPSPPRVVIQSGTCTSGNCSLWSVSISDGVKGVTARFESKCAEKSRSDTDQYVGPSA